MWPTDPDLSIRGTLSENVCAIRAKASEIEESPCGWNRPMVLPTILDAFVNPDVGRLLFVNMSHRIRRFTGFRPSASSRARWNTAYWP